MIEPTQLPTEQLLDSMTRKVAALMRLATKGTVYRGFHHCICGAQSSNFDLHVVVGGAERLTNSLAVHYVALHRAEVPPEQLVGKRLIATGSVFTLSRPWFLVFKITTIRDSGR